MGRRMLLLNRLRRCTKSRPARHAAAAAGSPDPWCTGRGVPECRRGRPAPDTPLSPAAQRRWCWPQCPCFRSFCIRCVDSLSDIPPRCAAHHRAAHPKHRPGRAARWGRSGSQRNPEIPAGIFPGYYTAESGWKWWADRSLPPFFWPSLRAGLPAPFWRAGSGPFLPKQRRLTKPAPRLSMVGRPSSLVSCTAYPASSLARFSRRFILMPRRAGWPCRPHRLSRCRRSFSGDRGSAMPPCCTCARSAQWSGTPE